MKAIITLSIVLLATSSFTPKQFSDKKVAQMNTTARKIAGVFGSFNVHRQHNSAALSWNCLSDNISSFAIERSYDGEWFEEIGGCAPETGRWHRYKDDTVEPGFIYYRVVAHMNGGATEYSPVAMVKIVKHK
ncbi:MAG TPA: hypothetical protein VJT83_05210 [Chitinophagaceae bacterium]|nr:hypothetical protein [Chitinophagaceae bacterium]